jgi:hypothetical protein
MAPRWVDKQAAHHRAALRTCVKVCGLIRMRLVALGIDPELAPALRQGDEAAAELAAIPDTAELQAADEALTERSSSGVEGRFAAELARIADNIVKRFGRARNRSIWRMPRLSSC